MTEATTHRIRASPGPPRSRAKKGPGMSSWPSSWSMTVVAPMSERWWSRVAARAGRMDVVRDVAYPLPIAVIASLFGFPAADRDRIKQWSDDLLIPFGRAPGSLSPAELERASHGGEALSQYVHALVKEARAHPRNDL